MRRLRRSGPKVGVGNVRVSDLSEVLRVAQGPWSGLYYIAFTVLGAHQLRAFAGNGLVGRVRDKDDEGGRESAFD